MTKSVSEEFKGFYHFYPGTVTLITSQAEGRPNVMAAAWHIPISSHPPLYGVAVSPKRFTYKLIRQSRQFGLNFLPFSQAKLIASVGGSTGQEIDKFQRFNIATEKALKIDAPTLASAYAAYECRLAEEWECGDHMLLVGEIVAIHQAEGAFTADDVLDLKQISPAMYLGNERYVTAAPDTITHLPREVYGQK